MDAFGEIQTDVYIYNRSSLKIEHEFPIIENTNIISYYYEESMTRNTEQRKQETARSLSTNTVDSIITIKQ